MNFSSIIRGIFKLWCHNNICCYQIIQTLPSENRIKLPLTETRGFTVVIFAWHVSLFTRSLTLQLPDQICNSFNCKPYNYCNASSENLY